jgi:hypothetical protein
MDNDPKLLARYANWFNIGHNNFEFVLDFGQDHAEQAGPMVHTRIVMGPAYAKELGRLLNESLERYEEAFGEIPKC